ncbi:hypothetical protein AQSSE17_07260 [Streptococcus equi subsp. equi]|nr:hypothetical protein AQSSE11_07340 [Streptococcus equi subsp. equi]GMX71348.1 hypothetical protein AQSSE02_09440 [Streptococcus equi subsp. equi]GMX72904.1 hypothetical protein AQSSE12_05170 [Streptococcus equi subsp. equi]GMX76593.1 hypothetical protein AQSSE13_03810 [Streptococcus equi subsp. equi]GMX76857.1 hypothetical protein AQSSE03_17320 [Streptococcus equi subsp. equi]
MYSLLINQAVDTKIPIDRLKPIKPLLGLHYRQVSKKDIEKYTRKKSHKSVKIVKNRQKYVNIIPLL